MALDEYNKALNRMIFGIKEETATECIDIGCENCEVIEKIKAEITQKTKDYNGSYVDGLFEALEIIDKHMKGDIE